MSIEKDYIYEKETIESIIENPEDSWKKQFKETIISMIATNKNDLLWYANFLSRCEYEFHFDESFTSAVYFNGKNFVIVINPVLLGLIEKDQIIAILKHNAGHIINHHFSRETQDNTIEKEIIETAKDIVINGNQELPYIKDLPHTGKYKDSPINAFFYQTLNEKYGIETYEIGREFEYYAELIKESLTEDSSEDSEENDQTCSNNIEEDSSDGEEDLELDSGNDADENDYSQENDDEINMESNSSQEREENNGPSSNDGNNDSTKDINNDTNKQPSSLSDKTLEALQNGEINIDSHEFGEQMKETIGLDNNLLESFMDTALKEMIEDSTSFARGFIPSEAMEAQTRIEKRKSHKDWRKILNKKMRNYLSNSLRYREPNKSRQHPIYPDDLDLYGYTPSKKPKLAVVLDVSGSVEDKLLEALMSEIQSIQRKYSIKNITLVQVDSELKSIEKFSIHDKFFVRHGGGGTVMEPGFTALFKQQAREIPDIIICATDGDVEKEFEHLKLPNKVQVIWLVPEKNKLLFDLSKYSKQQMHVIKFSL